MGGSAEAGGVFCYLIGKLCTNVMLMSVEITNPIFDLIASDQHQDSRIPLHDISPQIPLPLLVRPMRSRPVRGGTRSCSRAWSRSRSSWQRRPGSYRSVS